MVEILSRFPKIYTVIRNNVFSAPHLGFSNVFRHAPFRNYDFFSISRKIFPQINDEDHKSHTENPTK